MSKFPKLSRLLKRRDFLRIRGGSRRAGKWIVVETRPNRSSHSRLGITVTRRFGNAPQRNRFKRIVREAFRTSQETLPQGLDILVRPRTDALAASTPQIAAELRSLLKSK